MFSLYILKTIKHIKPPIKLTKIDQRLTTIKKWKKSKSYRSMHYKKYNKAPSYAGSTFLNLFIFSPGKHRPNQIILF